MAGTCGLLCLFERLCFLLSLICTPIYVIFMLSIIYAIKQEKSKRFLSFYWLLLSAGVADIWYLLHFYILNRFSKWGWVQWPFTYGGDWLPWWTVMGTWYLRQSQVLATFFMAINRLCAICWPLKYKVQWDGPFTIKAIAYQWCLAALVVVPAAVKCEIGASAFANGTREAFIKNGICGALMFGVQTVVQLAIVVALVVMYLVMYAEMKKQAKKVAPTKKLNKKLVMLERKAQQHLAVAGSLISFVLALYACSTAAITIVVFGWKIPALAPILAMIQGLLSMALSVINPFILVAICENLRKSFLEVCRKAVGKDAPPSVTIKPGATKSRKENEPIEIK